MSLEEYTLDITELRTAIRDRSATPLDRFRQPDFQDIRFGGYLVIDEGAVATMVESQAVQSYVGHYHLKDHLLFSFLKLSHEARGGGGTWRRIPAGSVNISSHTSSSIDVLRMEGHETATASVFVQKDYLVDHYGLDVETLPEQCLDVFRGRSDAHFMFSTVLSSRSWMALDAIFRCRMAEPLKSIYLRAKCQELLAETIGRLNASGGRELDKVASKHARERQMIETAALIYRRDLQNAPSVADLARGLGINRIKLTDGFREVFGVGPGDYAKRIRLDWAKEQLAAGVMSIGEAAFATGYSNSSAFARAYGEYFGNAPSSDCELVLA